MENNKIDYDYDLFKKRYFDFLNQETKQQITASKEKISGVYIIYLELKAINNMIPMYICHSVNIKSAFSIYKNRIKKILAMDTETFNEHIKQKEQDGWHFSTKFVNIMKEHKRFKSKNNWNL